MSVPLGPDTPIHTALTYYSTEDVKTGVMDVIRENLLTVILAAALIIWGFTAKLEMETRSPDGQVTTQTVTPASFVTDGMTGS